MPQVFVILGYIVYFWSNENDEPIHVHVCKGSPHENATKIIVPADGSLYVEHNKDKIPNKDMKTILRWIAQNKGRIYLIWYRIHQG